METNQIEERGLFNLSMETQKYPIAGFLFGLMFPLISWLIDIIFRNIDLSISGLWKMHINNPLHFVIDLAPFILGGVALILAKIIDKDQSVFKNEISSKKGYLQDILSFTDEISKGNYNAKLKTSNRDELIKKLNNMRDNLKNSTKREQAQNWKIKGRDIISTTMRQHNKIDELAYQLIEDIVNYTKLIQGSFFLFDEDEKTLNNIATYAYDRKKYINQQIQVGVGLIGQAAYELDYVYRREIPEDYTTLHSGIIGEKKPGAILIVPLISDEKLRGVIELASSEDEISEQVIEFVRELGEIIGQTIFNILINEKTANLLAEAQAMTTELQENEEELRQNAEEMRATQEELEKTNTSLASKIQEVQHTQTKLNVLLENASEVITILDQNAIVQYESPASINILGYHHEEKIGTYAFEDLGSNQPILEDLFQDVKSSPCTIKSIEFEYSRDEGTSKWLEVTAVNLIDNEAIAGVVLNTRDITQRKIAEVEQRKRGQMQALSENSVDIIIRIGTQKRFFYVNPIFTDYTGIETKDIFNKTIDTANLPKDLSDFFEHTLSDIKKQPSKREDELNLQLGESRRIMQVTSIPEFNESRELESVLFVAHDITERKEIELEIQDKNNKITESINYAKRIQKAILPDNKILQDYFPNSFIFYKPKDVVSGDFPWLFERGDIVYVAAVDCTGHGVPGALLSFIGYFLLQNIVDHDRELSAAEVCDELHYGVRKTLRQDQDGASARDGMDIALCKYNKKTKQLDFAGAHRPLYLLRNGELEIFKGDKKAIGGIPHKKKLEKDFTNYTIQIQENDKIFFFSDGLPDQVGGEDLKKYQTKRMQEIINNNNEASMTEFSNQFVHDFNKYKGDHKQIDDVLLIGIGF
ncbi:MAG: PAS domain S-box protein [Bacteroidales bacterium]|nr:PAS domain S-box protein [Bacteroidales bacterium]